jgi:ubiquinone/menaquinone biosynthesis C-methylase UbiE
MPKVQLTVEQAYALWAETYDTDANPLLALEERYLQPMLPSLADKTVLDLGCGTGRLLERFPSTTGWYLGIDISAAMLQRAATKLRVHGHFLRADCLRLPLHSRSVSVVICSFLLGYVNVRDLAAEIARVSKDDTDLYLSEFHPDSDRLGWKRSFRFRGHLIELPTAPCVLHEVEDVFRLHGFELVHLAEPCLGEAERNIFLAHNKVEAFESSRGVPAIFIFHLRRSSRAA